MTSTKCLIHTVMFLGLVGFSSASWSKSIGSISTSNHRQVEFPKMALISSSDAVKAAKDKVHGDILSLALESENGSLVYAVEIINAQTGLHEINIDAGNGKILSDETKDHLQPNPADEANDD